MSQRTRSKALTRLAKRYLPGISHWVQQDAPEAVNEMIACFLSGTSVPEFPQK